MSSAADYQGHTFDVLAFQGAKATGEVLLVNNLVSAGNSGEICTGVQKLAQRWLIEFLTIQGSLQYLPTRGCEFMFLIQTGQLRTTLDAQQAFYLSAATVRTNLRAEETGTEPNDERIDKAQLLSITVSGDRITLRVEIDSLAGTSRKVILPIPVTIKN